MSLKYSKLTRTNIRSLQPGQEISEHGISFRRLANGDGRYAINVMVDGQRVHRVIGKESAGVTRKQAEELIEKLKTEARHGRLSLPKGRKLALGFSEAAKQYLARLEKSDGKDMRSKRYQLKLHLVPFFKDTPLSKISTFEVERFKKLRREQGVKKSTVNRELSCLSHLLNSAVEWGWLDHNPCKIKKFKETQTKTIYLTQEQIARLLEVAKNDSNPNIYLFILIGLETSMRKMEILSIALNDIDLAKREIHVPKAKAGARQQPITEHLADYLAGIIKNTPSEQQWLFPAKQSKTGHTISIEKPFRRVVAKAGLDPTVIVRHTLRHTVITHLVQAGVDIPTVQRISGHKTPQMVMRYSHQNSAHIQAAMDTLEQRYALDENGSNDDQE